MIRITQLNYKEVCLSFSLPVTVTVDDVREYLTRNKSTVMSQGLVVNKSITLNNLL